MSVVRLDDEVSTGRGELDGVGEQVSDDLAETDGVSVDQEVTQRRDIGVISRGNQESLA